MGLQATGLYTTDGCRHGQERRCYPPPIIIHSSISRRCRGRGTCHAPGQWGFNRSSCCCFLLPFQNGIVQFVVICMQWSFHNGWMAAAAEAVAVKKQNYEKRKKSFGVVYIYFCQAGGVHTERFLLRFISSKIRDLHFK